jgi:hypothetical protein
MDQTSLQDLLDHQKSLLAQLRLASSEDQEPALGALAARLEDHLEALETALLPFFSSRQLTDAACDVLRGCCDMRQRLAQMRRERDEPPAAFVRLERQLSRQIECVSQMLLPALLTCAGAQARSFVDVMVQVRLDRLLQSADDPAFQDEPVSNSMPVQASAPAATRIDRPLLRRSAPGRWLRASF